MTQPGDPAPSGTGPPASLVAGLLQILRPLVRLLLRHQLTFPFLARLLKQVYVEVAVESLRREEQRETDSRVSLRSGVHRKDVRVLRSAEATAARAPRSVSLGARIVQEWTSRPELQAADGSPLPLPRSAEREGGPCFDALVASVSKDISARSVLDEWLRLGLAEIDADNRVRLRVEGFVPRHGFEEKAFYFGRNLRDHLAAAAHNLAEEDEPMLERSVFYEQLSDESVSELEGLAEGMALRALRDFDRRARELKQRDAARGGGRRRVTLGAYFFRGDSDAERPEAGEE